MTPLQQSPSFKPAAMPWGVKLVRQKIRAF
jgi:hypothetical protein